MSSTRILSALGVYHGPGPDELAVLQLANDYRQALCQLWHERHRQLVDLRNDSFPELFDAMVQWEATKSRIWYVERQIKTWHSQQRDRNAVPEDLAERLEELRHLCQEQYGRVKLLREPWFAVGRCYSTFFSSLRDWKRIKLVASRQAAYASIVWPTQLQTYADLCREQKDPPDLSLVTASVIEKYGRITLDNDLRMRELSKKFQDAGLHSAIREEISAASLPKTSKTGPGMRYEYRCKPEPAPWIRLTLRLLKPLSLPAIVAGHSAALQLKPVYRQQSGTRSHTLYNVVQQIGTVRQPRRVTYCVKFHREMPPDSVIKTWSLNVRDGKRYVTPLVTNVGSKPQGQGTFGYDLRWSKVPEGLLVCRFVGDHVNEDLILPDWLLERRMCLSPQQMACDNQANQVLAERGLTPGEGARQGVSALEDYCRDYPADAAAAAKLAKYQQRLADSRRRAQRALRCIEKIYETVTRRVCSRHAAIVPDTIELQRVKRYKTRNLLQADPVPAKSREYLAAAAPGKLAGLLKNYGLATGTAASLPELPPEQPPTKLFSDYVRSLRQPTGTKPNAITHREQLAAQACAEA